MGASLGQGSGGAGGRSIAALIPAAGSGTRLGMGFKALVDVGGKTLLERAILNLAPHVDQIAIAIDPQMYEAVKNLLERLSLTVSPSFSPGEISTYPTLLANSEPSVLDSLRRFSDGSGEAAPRPYRTFATKISRRGRALPDPRRLDSVSSRDYKPTSPTESSRACPPLTLIFGGKTRQASVKNLLESTNAQYVLIHDAARPFLSARVITDMLEAIQKHGAATVALPCVDTLVRSSGELWEALLDRSEIQAIQTPQGGRRDWLLEAHQSALEQNWSATDDAGLLAREGRTVHLVRGDPRLFKVTTPEDLEMARALADFTV